MVEVEWPPAGDILVWASGGHAIRGMVIAQDATLGLVCLLLDPASDAHAWVPARQCTPATAAHGPADHPAYRRALEDAAGAVAAVVASYAVAGDLRRCAGASRAYGALEHLIDVATL
ncbi:hypothetical protein ACRAWC_01105 [Leifsonia sp. L25]|uniref:hypothetical protein n=1 Tax=Actinomycetes TaxID=1760 RepID=UPI003D68F1E2